MDGSKQEFVILIRRKLYEIEYNKWHFLDITSSCDVFMFIYTLLKSNSSNLIIKSIEIFVIIKKEFVTWHFCVDPQASQYVWPLVTFFSNPLSLKRCHVFSELKTFQQRQLVKRFKWTNRRGVTNDRNKDTFWEEGGKKYENYVRKIRNVRKLSSQIVL